jgi:glycine/D-amino acid oxidase-like deaminating enzyme
MVPDFAAYFDEDAKERVAAKRGISGSGDRSQKPFVDGGYYTKTVENLPLIGPAPGLGGKGNVPGAYICAALSGYGIMAGASVPLLLSLLSLCFVPRVTLHLMQARRLGSCWLCMLLALPQLTCRRTLLL